MNAPPPPPPQTPQEGTSTAVASTTSGVAGVFGIFALIPLIALLVFHLGAAYLSYQKFGSMMWAVVDFIFAYFYYPYYAFFLASTPAVSAPMTPTAMVGGMMKALSGARRRR